MGLRYLSVLHLLVGKTWHVGQLSPAWDGLGNWQKVVWWSEFLNFFPKLNESESLLEDRKVRLVKGIRILNMISYNYFECLHLNIFQFMSLIDSNKSVPNRRSIFENRLCRQSSYQPHLPLYRAYMLWQQFLPCVDSISDHCELWLQVISDFGYYWVGLSLAGNQLRVQSSLKLCSHKNTFGWFR